MQCLILAGGLGTRISDKYPELPKHLVPVLGRPFAEHQLRRLVLGGVRRVVYSLGYRADQIHDFVKDGKRFGLEDVQWVYDGVQPLGTGGAVKRAASYLDERFVVIYGDSYLPVDILPIWKAFEGSGCPALMTVLHNKDRWGASNACFMEERVTLYRKGERLPLDPELEYIDYGISAHKKSAVLAALPEGPCPLEGYYETLSRSGRLAGYEVRERFYEVGSHQGIAELEEYLKASTPG